MIKIVLEHSFLINETKYNYLCAINSFKRLVYLNTFQTKVINYFCIKKNHINSFHFAVFNSQCTFFVKYVFDVFIA